MIKIVADLDFPIWQCIKTLLVEELSNASVMNSYAFLKNLDITMSSISLTGTLKYLRPLSLICLSTSAAQFIICVIPSWSITYSDVAFY